MLNALPTLTKPSAPAPQAAGPARSDSVNESGAEGPAFARQLQEAQSGEAAARASARNAAEAQKSAAAKSNPKLSRAAREPAEAEAAQDRLRASEAAAGQQHACEESTGIAPDGLAEPALASEAEEDLMHPEASAQVLGLMLAQLRGQTAAERLPGEGNSGDSSDSSDSQAADLSVLGGAQHAKGLRHQKDTERTTNLLAGQEQALQAKAGAEDRHEGTNANFMEQNAEQQASDHPAHAGLNRLAETASTTLAGPAATAQPFATQMAKNMQASAQAQLSAALGSPDFAPQLGSQITTFVRDGVQHAQLHLNPAEMGPVSVQIQLEGQGARVHLMADQANTRQALEQALPQLAGSLREAGLTLTGGGVSQQPRQSGGDGRNDGRSDGSSDGRSDGSTRGGRARTGTQAVGAVDSGLAGAAASRRRGVVDLIA